MPVSQVEKWRAIPGYEGRYEVSDQGQVRSLGLRVKARGGKTAFRKGKVLRTAVKAHGYLQVTLIDAKGRRWCALVHQLVCLAFVGPASGLQVCHWDGDRTNNCLSNLRYGTASDNSADRWRHGWFIRNRNVESREQTGERDGRM